MMRLALALGKSLGEIEALPASEFARWMAWDNLSPIGALADDLHYARMGALVANVAGSKSVKVRDFMLSPDLLGESREPTQKTLFGKLMAWAKAAGATFIKPGEKV